MTNLYFFHLHGCYSIFQNFFCAGIQFFVVLNSYKFSFGFNANQLLFVFFGKIFFTAGVFCAVFKQREAEEYVVIPRGTFAVLTYSVDGLRVDKHDIPIA